MLKEKKVMRKGYNDQDKLEEGETYGYGQF
jgi:hypothetical protein